MYVVIVPVIDSLVFQATCEFNHCYTMAVKQGDQMCANVVKLSCNLDIMSVVMMSAVIPWQKMGELLGKVFVWYQDNNYHCTGTPALVWKPQ